MPCHRRFPLAAAASALLLLPGCHSVRFPNYSASYREFAYVANSGTNTVSVLDLVNLRKDREVMVAPHPVAVAANPQRNEIYAVSMGAPGTHGSLAIIDTETNAIAGQITVGKAPRGLDVERSGRYAFVVNSGSNNLSVIDLAAHRVTSEVGTGEEPESVRVAPDATTLVVANHKSGSVSLYGLAPNNSAPPKLRGSFNGCPGAGSIAILPDSNKAFVACSDSHRVMVVGLRTSPEDWHRHSSSFVEEPDRLIALLDVGTNPAHLALKPDGGEIFVANHGENTISEIATGTNDVGGASLIGSHPVFGIASADNTLLWVANEDGGTVAVYSIEDGKLINTVRVGDNPCVLAFSADGHLLLSVDRGSGDIAAIRTFDRNLHRQPVYGSLFTMLPAGKQPVAIAVKAFHARG